MDSMIDVRMPPEGVQPETAAERIARTRQIRASLPGQVLRERIDAVRLLYGPLYTMDEALRRARLRLPYRFGATRRAAAESVEQFGEVIPDEALLKYDDARRTGLFARFWVVVPAYSDQSTPDPWLLGEITGTSLVAVIAEWDV